MEAEADVLQYPLVTQIRSDSLSSSSDVRATAASSEPDLGAELIARYRNGDVAAFEQLMRAFRAPIYGFFRRSGASLEVADDLFQEAFLRVHAHAASYDGARPFRVWLFTIAHNLMRSHWRKAAVRRVLVGWWAGPPGDESQPDAPDPKAGPDEQAATHDALRWLEAALMKLPERHRQALVLTQIEGLSLEEAAEVLSVPIATVKTWVHRGRATLAAARKTREGDAS